MDKELAQWVIIAATSLLLVGIAAATWTALRSFNRTNPPEKSAVRDFVSSGAAERWFTVAILSYVLLVLSATGTLNDGILPFLAALGGFTLGRGSDRA